MFNENAKYEGLVTMELRGPDGKVKQKFEHKHNIVTNAGLAHNIQRLLNNTSAVVNAVAIGTGTTAEAADQTTLASESARVAAEATVATTNVSGDSIQYVATFPAGTPSGTSAITEAGLFNSTTASSGTMTNRVVFGVITKEANDSLTCSWKLTVSG